MGHKNLAVGFHILGDVFFEKGFPDNCNSHKKIEYFLSQTENKIREQGLELLDTSFHIFGESAFTAMFLLAESHISLHTWPEKQYISFDIFVCHHHQDNTEKAKNILNFLTTEYFKNATINLRQIERGF